ncbi:hypothetical protein DIPPA_22724 [Diplonema papillatum]|nr:hypothetical protein DIPPA_22724 [Diplonema papillatum]
MDAQTWRRKTNDDNAFRSAGSSFGDNSTSASFARTCGCEAFIGRRSPRDHFTASRAAKKSQTGGPLYAAALSLFNRTGTSR